MRRQSLFLMTILLALVCTAHANDATIRKELDANYAKIVAGFKKKDLKALTDLITTDFTMSQGGKTMDRAEAESNLKAQLAITNSVEKISIKIQSLKVNGNTAVATSQFDMAATITGEDKKPHKFTDSESDKDTWVKTPQGWRLKIQAAVKSSFTMDGKPFDPMNGAPKQ